MSMSEFQEGPQAGTEVVDDHIIRAKWNKEFRLPKPVLPDSMPVRFGFSLANTEIARHTVEIEREGQVIRGEVIISANTKLPADPKEELGQSAIPRKTILQPSGRVPIRTEIVQDTYTGEAKLVATEAPLIITVKTQGNASSGKNNYRIQHAVRYGEHVFEGNLEDISGVHSEMTTEYNEWSDKAAGVDGNGIIYLPYSPETFDKLEIVIGDTPPKPKS